MFNALHIPINPQVQEIYLSHDGKDLTIGEFITALQYSKDFRAWYNRLLADSPFEGFFWENAPFRKDNLNESYRFTLISTRAFEAQKPDPESFLKYFSPSEPVISCANLSGDSQLIIPTMVDGLEGHGHLASFVRSSNLTEIDALWSKVGEVVSACINEKSLWLSTSGLGVPWLHVRVDRRPKYYHYDNYKNG